ncbi:MAG: serine/threonine-protein kinase PknK [Proteobacteria bacterium]|nr:serine/threonine-protein kinase PknK [Pseudomonadota bacterium]
MGWGSAHTDPEFDRYDVEGTLGAGALGVVYRVRDNQTDTPMALKVMRGVGAERQLRLKAEFRRVASLAHPNLAAVYELGSNHGELFFTMELVDGQPFVRALDNATDDVLRDAIRQFLGGLAALHEAGLVHRDIKPNNVLVEPGRRVVVLDFGLAATHEEGRAESGSIVGTAAFMSPEQAAGQPARGASDLYAVGVMLYQLLAGRPLTLGPPTWVQRQRRSQLAPAVRQQAPGRAPDLVDLCEKLLARSPFDRPTAREAEARLGEPADRISGPLPKAQVLVGRAALLRQLESARRTAAEDRRAVVVEVLGEAGIGKSSLVTHFLDVIVPPDAIVLRGRCYEQETVPFKGFDTLAEAIVRYVRTLPFQAVAALFPEPCGALRRLFPVLRSIIPRERIDDLGGAAPAEVRRQAQLQFCDLPRRLSEGRNVVLSLDDLHWADQDSHGLLAALLGTAEERPPALFLLSARPKAAQVAGLSVLLDRFAPAREAVTVGALDPTAALELARLRTNLDGEAAAAIVEATAGNPLLIELVGAGSDESLEAAIGRRLGSLEPQWREAAELVAVAGVPISRRVIEQAAGGMRKPLKAWVALRAARLVRTHGPSPDSPVEPWHDRIRESVTASLPDTVRAERHAALGTALEIADSAEPHTVGQHLRLGGLVEYAFPHLLRAAEQALEARAFDRSAELYRDALDCADNADIDRADAQVGLAEALVAGGRLGEAGEAFEHAAEIAEPHLYEALMARASQAWMLGGHIQPGRDALVPILGPHKPLGPLASIANFVVSLIRSLWAMNFKSVPEDQVPPEVLRRIDTLWSIASSMTLFDEQSSARIFGRHHLLAFQTGEPIRATRAQIFSAMQMCSFLPKKADAVLAEVRARLDATPHPELDGFYWVTVGMVQSFAGRFAEALEHMDRGLDLLREHCAGGMFATTIGEQAAGITRLELGRLGELRRTSLVGAQRAVERGNFSRGAFSAAFLSHVALADDEPERARALLEPVRERLKDHRFHQQHWLVLAAETRRDLYEGRVPEACARWMAAWPEVSESYLLYLKESAIRVRRLRGPLLAADGATKEACKVAAKLSKAGWPGARGSGAGVRAILLRDDPERCQFQLGTAADFFDAAGMHVDAAACRLLGARMLEEDVGPHAQRLRLLGVTHPQRWASMVVPGLL